MDHELAPVNNIDIDLDLAERVRQAIGTLDVLRGSRAHVDVTVANGHVTLAGNVQSPMAAAEVGHAAAEIAGAAVTNHVVDDATLSRRVAVALSTDPRTAPIGPGYQVASTFGHLWLVGRFTPEQSSAVTAVCQAVAGVRSVTIKAF